MPAFLLLACATTPSPTSELYTTTISTGTEFAVAGNPASGQLYLDLQGILWRMPLSGGAAQALTGIEDDARRMRLGPDGTRIALQTFKRGYWDIAITAADGSNRRVLTTGKHDNRGPAWSADGETLYFASDRSGNYDIWSVHLATGMLTQITADAADDYAPTVAGEQLVFISARNRKAALYGLDLRQPGDPILVVNSAAGKLHPPSLSPDGSKLAYVQAIERNAFPSVARNELVVRDMHTGAAHRVSATGSDVFGQAPSWLNNTTLLYTANGRIQQLDTATATTAAIPFRARLPLRRASYQQLAPPVFTLDTKNAHATLGIVDPVFLPDNSIVFSALGDLYKQAPSGELTQLTNDAFVERDLGVAPDGHTLSYISDIDGSMQIWLRDLRTGETRRMTDNSSGPRYPTFSPDGTELAWLQVGPRGMQDFTLRVMNLASRKSVRLRAAPKIWPGRIAWSADGMHIIVAELHRNSARIGAGANRLVRINIAQDTAAALDLDGRVPDFGPVASSTHDQIALVIDGALWRVAITADGRINGAPRLVLDELVESPAWRQDGDAILVLTNAGLETTSLDGRMRNTRNPDLTWQAAANDAPLLVHAGRVWDGSSNNYQHGMDILIVGGRIASMQEHNEHPPGLSVIDASDKTILPGLIDHHVHFEPHKGEITGRQLLAFGITTVVEPGGLPYESREHMESWASGRRDGPRLVFAGPQLDGARKIFHFAAHVNNERRLMQELERGARLGYGMIKTYESLQPGLQALAVTRAHDQGLPVSAHAAFRNLGNGGDRIEHLRGSSRVASNPKQSSLLKSYADLDAILMNTAASLTPTIVNQGSYFDSVLRNPQLTETPQYTALYTTAYRDNLAAFTRVVAKNHGLIRQGVGNVQASIKRLHDGGVRVVAGTDSPIFPYGLALVIELSSYVEAGLTPLQALQTATSGAASELGASAHVGRLAPGMLADMVLVSGDPLSNIADIANVDGVVLNGRYFSTPGK
jgi:Tol biopolymer transport system component/cytosine/adenosine deaminase-related metal-dependent hydrolase